MYIVWYEMYIVWSTFYPGFNTYTHTLCTLYNVHRVVCVCRQGVHCTTYSVRYTVYIVWATCYIFYPEFITRYTLYVHRILYALSVYTMYSEQYTVYSVECWTIYYTVLYIYYQPYRTIKHNSILMITS